ncbi:unnamed protein product, partial [Pylaiella littoralis]
RHARYPDTQQPRPFIYASKACSSSPLPHHCRGEPFDINTREEPSLSTTAGERGILIQPSRPIIYASEARQSSPASPH